MNVLMLAPYPPYPPRGGGQQRMYQLLRQLAAMHTVHLLTFAADAAAIEALEPLGSICRITTVPAPQRSTAQRLQTTLFSRWPDMLWRGRSTAFLQALHELVNREKPDVIQAESIEMTQYAPLHQHHASRQPLWLYDSFNVEYTIQQRAFLADREQFATWPKAGYSWIQWHKLRRFEQHLHERFDGAFAVSAQDQALLQQLDPALLTWVVPNGVDTSFFTPLPPAGTSNVLFTGTLDYRPNVDALLWFSALVWPQVLAAQPTARFVIVGRNPTAAVVALDQQPGITVVGEVPDVRPFFAEAAVYVVPMRIGGGVRLKMLEAFAQALPVVTTTLGAEGIAGFAPATHALVADQPGAFAAAVSTLLHDRQQAAQLGAAARQLMTECYDWRAIAPRMTAAWEHLVAARRIHSSIIL